MFGHAIPSQSSNPKFIFLVRMTATNPTESSQTMAFTEREFDEVLEVTPEVKEVMFTLTKGKKVEKNKKIGRASCRERVSSPV